MKSLKLKAKHYKDLEQLLVDAGAVNKKTNRAFPSHIYVSSEDMKKMNREITKLFKKEYPYVNPKKLQASVGMHMLNLSPNDSLGKVIKAGYALVDNESLALEISGDV
jgi:hypothetical protein